MSSSAILDFERLLAPVPGEKPGGKNLREDFSPASIYQKMKDHRAIARTLERKILNGDEVEGTGPDWEPVLNLAPAAIAEQSKDLEIAAWLTEALLREHGFAGLREGLRLARELVERYWDQLYPLADSEADGVAGRVAALAGLNVTLIYPINNTPLTAGKSHGPYAKSDYDRADAIEKVGDPEKRARQIESAGGFSIQSFKAAVRESSPEFFAKLSAELSGCLDELEKLSTALDGRCGEHSPPLSGLRGALEGCKGVVESEAGHLLEKPADAQGAAGDAGATSTAVGANGAPGVARAGGGMSRKDAFDLVKRAARYFRENEPHSPMSYALERVVEWGDKSLPDLWSELIGEEQVRLGVFKLVGIKPPEVKQETN